MSLTTKYFTIKIKNEEFPMTSQVSFSLFVNILNRTQLCSGGDLYYNGKKLTECFPAPNDENNGSEYFSALENLKNIENEIQFIPGADGVTPLVLSSLPLGQEFNPPVGTYFDPLGRTSAASSPPSKPAVLIRHHSDVSQVIGTTISSLWETAVPTTASTKIDQLKFTEEQLHPLSMSCRGIFVRDESKESKK